MYLNMQTKTPVALYMEVRTRPPSPFPSLSPPPRVFSQTRQILGLQRLVAKTSEREDSALRPARQRKSLIDSCKALGVRQKLVKNSCCWVLIDHVFILTAATLQTVSGLLQRSPLPARTRTNTHRQREVI